MSGILHGSDFDTAFQFQYWAAGGNLAGLGHVAGIDDEHGTYDLAICYVTSHFSRLCHPGNRFTIRARSIAPGQLSILTKTAHEFPPVFDICRYDFRAGRRIRLGANNQHKLLLGGTIRLPPGKPANRGQRKDDKKEIFCFHGLSLISI